MPEAGLFQQRPGCSAARNALIANTRRKSLQARNDP
jgi:hypothetical protein